MKLDQLPPRYQQQVRQQQERQAAPKPRLVQSHTPGRMNATEAAYARVLEARKLAGEITDYLFEAVKLRLATATFYTPDFMVRLPNGEIEIHEVKGYWMEDARVKWKVAAAKYHWWRFVAVTKSRGGWEREYYRN
jgi:hypothetical protein